MQNTQRGQKILSAVPLQNTRVATIEYKIKNHRIKLKLSFDLVYNSYPINITVSY